MKRIPVKKLIPVIAALIGAFAYFGGFVENSSVPSPPAPGQLVKTDRIPLQILQPKKEGLGANKSIQAQVFHVVDGDTIEVRYKGEELTVRLLCVDTPESVKPGVEPQPYSKEASKLVEQLVLDKEVKLVFDKGLRDRYGRLLAHVLLEDGEYLNALLVRNGLARVEIVSPNTTYKAYFFQLQEDAIADKTGFWGIQEGQQPFLRNEKGDWIPRYRLKKAS